MAVFNFTDWYKDDAYEKNGEVLKYDFKQYETDLLSPNAEKGLAPSFGKGSILNYANFDLNGDKKSDYKFLNKYINEQKFPLEGAYAAAIEATSGFIQIKSNYNGYNSFVATKDKGLSDDDKAAGVLFDFWHIDGLSNGDYVTAQITAASTQGNHLSMYGEVDAFETESYYAKMMSWPYLQHDVLVVDTSEAGTDYSLGDVNYTLQVVTDWKDVKSASQYNAFDWGSFDFTPVATGTAASDEKAADEATAALYDDLNWGQVQFNEFKETTWETVDFSQVDFVELDKKDITDIIADAAVINADAEADLDVVVLDAAVTEFTGGATCDLIVADGKTAGVEVAGGEDADKFVLKKGKGDIIITDFEVGIDQINTDFVKGSIKLKKSGKDTQIFAGSDLLATVEDVAPSKLKKKGKGIF